MKVNKTAANLLRLAFSVGIIILLFWQIGFVKILQTLAQANWEYVLWGTILVFISLLGSYANVQFIVWGLENGKKIAKSEVFKGFALSYSLGNFVPGKLGELSLAYFLKKSGLGLGESTMVTLVDKFVSTIVLLVLGAAGIGLLIGWKGAIQIMVLGGLAGLIAFALLFTSWGTMFIKKYILKKISEKFKGFRKSFKEIVRAGFPIPLNVIGTFVRWGFNAAAMWFLFAAFNVHVDWISLYLIPAIITVLVLIPVTISGLGLRESVAVYLFSLVGVSVEVTLSVYILINIIRYFYVGVFLILYNREKVVTRQQQEA